MAPASKILKPATAQWYSSILAARKTARRPKKNSGPTINVVSPDLCDDILQRLSPSLKRHENCDIIDINPGVGLWSSKLHEHLRPRSHILVEPLEEYYRPFLEPLLSQPGSKYRLADIQGLSLDSYDTILKRGMLPDQQPLPTASGSTNDSLLLVANVAYPSKQVHQLRISQTQKWVHRFFRKVRDQAGFHSYGLVRLLLWVLDDEKAVILPRSIANRHKLAVEIEICSTTEEVAGADAAAGLDRRVLDLDIASAKRVAQAMKDRNIDVPEGRQAVLHKMVTDQATDSDGAAHYGLRKWHHELEALRKDFRDGVFTEYVDQSTRERANRKSTTKPAEVNRARTVQPPKRARTPQWTRMAELMNNINAQGRWNQTAENVGIEQAELDARQDALQHLELSDNERSVQRKQLHDKITQLQQTVENGIKGFAKKVAFYADDRRAAQQSPPLLQWDRRSAEPLVVHDNEFHPKQPMALLDIQPKPVKTVPDFDVLLASIFNRPARPIGGALDSLAPGAADALIPDIRGLRSRLNPEAIRSRVLTTEMIDDLLNAWDNWPFRPRSAKLWSTAGDAVEEKFEFSKRA